MEQEVLTEDFHTRLSLKQKKNLEVFLNKLSAGQDLTDQFRSFCDWLGGANYSLEEMVKLHEENNFAYFKQEKLKQLCICHRFKIRKGSQMVEVEFFCSRCRLLPATFQRCKSNRLTGLQRKIITDEDLKGLQIPTITNLTLPAGHANPAPFPGER